ncbi:class I SAM-dependent methyltransferase [Pseudonocardia nantongensis]|uniref:class I SAM-dependent methyltransferase n=1 Tax=Pseudonocardia nantongensis TaxID=1181885 RepID=UPI003978CD38
METTPQPDFFDRAYIEGDPPWVIGEPQPAVVALADRGELTGRILEPGCGTGEHTVHLTRLGLDVLGTDASPTAIERARARADSLGVAARFAVADALRPDDDLGVFDTVLDSALFHLFDARDQARYAHALAGLVVPGGTVHVLALAVTGGREFGPVIEESAITDAFAGPDWAVAGIGVATYRGIVTADLAESYGEPAGTRVEVPAHLARITRT